MYESTLTVSVSRANESRLTLCARAELRGADPDRHEVSNFPQTSFCMIDSGVERNAYGRQVDSHIAALKGPTSAWTKVLGCWRAIKAI